jgi:hypothetical protein
LASASGIEPRNVNIRELHQTLLAQDVVLPAGIA